MIQEELEKLAKEIAEKANECCHRSDGYEEDICAIALKALEKAVSLPHWIDIRDQEPPPKGQSVLITDGNVRAVASWNGFRKDGTLIWDLEGVGGHEVETDWRDPDITHWMPSPELPGKGKNA